MRERKKVVILLFFNIFLFAHGIVYAQKDTTAAENEIIISEKRDTVLIPDSAVHYKKPGRASLYSALIPGLGQAYNNNYWKIPIVYTALATTIFWADFNNKKYHRFKTAYLYNTDTIASTIDEFNGTISADNLLYYTKKHRRNRDLSIILSVVFYGFNIVDAAVDAYMWDYDIGDDIVLKISPVILPVNDESDAIGFSLNFNFGNKKRQHFCN